MAGFTGGVEGVNDVSLFADISRADEQMLSYCNPSVTADKEKLSNLERNFMLSLANMLLQLQYYDSAIVVARDLLRSVQVLE